MRRLLQRLALGSRPANPRPGIAGERLDGVREAGVLYWRSPDSERGNIFSITLKKLPVLVGDGKRTLGELIDADPRARYLRGIYRRRHRQALDRVLEPDEVLHLVFAGNHCQGAVFLDGTDLVTPELEERIHRIASTMPEFYFGRFDICFADPRSFLRGDESPHNHDRGRDDQAKRDLSYHDEHSSRLDQNET